MFQRKLLKLVMNSKKQTFHLPDAPQITTQEIARQELWKERRRNPKLALEAVAKKPTLRQMVQTNSLEHPGNLELSGEFQKAAYMGLMSDERVQLLMQEARGGFYDECNISIDNLALFVRQFSQKRETAYVGDKEYQAKVKQLGKYIVAVQNISRILAFIPDSLPGITLYETVLSHVQTPDHMQVQGLALADSMKQTLLQTVTDQTKENVDFDNNNFIEILPNLTFKSLEKIQTEFKKYSGADLFDSKIFDGVVYEKGGENPRVLHTKITYNEKKQEVVLVYPYIWDENREPTSSQDDDEDKPKIPYFGTKPTGFTFNHHRDQGENETDNHEPELERKLENDSNGTTDLEGELDIQPTQITTNPSDYVRPLSTTGTEALKKLKQREAQLKQENTLNELLETKNSLLKRLSESGLFEYQLLDLLSWLELKFNLNTKQRSLPVFVEIVEFLQKYPEFEAEFETRLLSMIETEVKPTTPKPVRTQEPIQHKPKSVEKPPTQKTLEKLHKEVVGKIEKNIRVIEQYLPIVQSHIDDLTKGIESNSFPELVVDQSTNKEFQRHYQSMHKLLGSGNTVIGIAMKGNINLIGLNELYNPDTIKSQKNISKVLKSTPIQSDECKPQDLLNLFTVQHQMYSIHLASAKTHLEVIKDNFEQVKNKSYLQSELLRHNGAEELDQEQIEYQCIEAIMEVADLVWQGKQTARITFQNTIRFVENLLTKSPEELEQEPYFATPRFGLHQDPIDKKTVLANMLSELKKGIAELDTLKAKSLINMVKLVGILVKLQSTCVGFLKRETVINGINVVESQYHLIGGLSTILHLLTSDAHRLTYYPQLQMYLRTHVEGLATEKQKLYENFTTHQLLTNIIGDKQSTVDVIMLDPNSNV